MCGRGGACTCSSTSRSTGGEYVDMYVHVSMCVRVCMDVVLAAVMEAE